MKSIEQYIKEANFLKISKAKYTCCPKTKEELQQIIKDRVDQYGPECDLNDIDVSLIADMSFLFYNLHKKIGYTEYCDFNGHIEYWDVSRVKDMKYMFIWCENFNQDISRWDVSNVEDMESMFNGCKNFNQDISNWNVTSTKNMNRMFSFCDNFNQDLSKWIVSDVEYMEEMFLACENFNKNLSNWDVSKVVLYRNIFKECPLKNQYKKRPKFN